jgi:hypothetical protein
MAAAADNESSIEARRSYVPRPRKPWTEDEDRRLKRAVEAEPLKEKIDWARVAVDGVWTRPRKACRERWHMFHLPHRTGVWTEEETLILLAHCGAFGRRYVLYEPLIEGRNQTSIKNKWIALHSLKQVPPHVCILARPAV